MTKKQIREYKQENKVRKAAIRATKDALGKRNSIWYLGGLIQDGKYTPAAK